MLPATECLADVVARVLPYWQDVIAPQLIGGLDVLVTAHGNSLRALLMHLEGVSRDAIAEINIPTGVPRRYELDDRLGVIAADTSATPERSPRRPPPSPPRPPPPERSPDAPCCARPRAHRSGAIGQP